MRLYPKAFLGCALLLISNLALAEDKCHLRKVLAKII